MQKQCKRAGKSDEATQREQHQRQRQQTTTTTTTTTLEEPPADLQHQEDQVISSCMTTNTSTSPFFILTSKQLNEQEEKFKRRESCASIGDLLKQEELPLIRLNWSTRLTVILVGASILFSMFFALEFLIAKLVSGYFLFALGSRFPYSEVAATTTTSISNPTPPLGCQSPINWPRLVSLNGGHQFEWSPNGSNHLPHEADGRHGTATNEQQQQQPPAATKQLGVDFDLIYEDELAREGPLEMGGRLPAILSAQEKLRRILEAYHVAMPFNPDIWLLSDARKQLHLLSGEPATCLSQLRQLHGSIKRALDGSGQTSGGGAAAAADRGANMRQFKLLQWLDSFGRPEAGSLMAHPFWLGSFVECQQLNEPASQKWLPIQSRYCVGKLAYSSWRTSTSASASSAHVSIKVGLCLPRQCDSLALFEQKLLMQTSQTLANNQSLVVIDQIKEQIKQLMMINFNHEAAMVGGASATSGPDKLELLDVHCLPLAEKLGLSLAGYLLISLLVVWLIVVAVCTFLRRSKPDHFRNNQLVDIMAFDVNLELFLKVKCEFADNNNNNKPKRAINLNVLDSVKHLGCVGVIGAHVLLTNLTLGTAYSYTIETIGKDMRTMMLLSLNNIVDTFFVISGLLVAYLTFKKLHKQVALNENHHRRRPNEAKKNIEAKKSLRFLRQYAKIVASRYLRMGPLYFLVFAFAKLISVHLGEGPLWDYATNKETLRGYCEEESWLWPVAFASDFKPLTQHCVPPAWSIAVDLQFFLFLPLLISLLYHWRPLTGYLLLGSLIVMSTVCTMDAYRSLLDYVSLEDFGKLRLHVFTIMLSRVAQAYSLPHNRMGPILVGLIGGHLLFEYERRLNKSLEKNDDDDKRTNIKKTNNDNDNKWPRFMRGKWLTLIITASVLFVLAPNLVQFRERLRSRHLAIGLTKLNSLDRLARLVLNLNSSSQFDFYLALGGFILIKPLWSICNCLLFLRLITDLNSGLLARLMSLNMWQILAKLNYAILLIHFELIKYDQMSQLSLSQPISWSFLVGKFSFAYLLSILLAGPLFVLIEQPIQRLSSACLARHWRTSALPGKEEQTGGCSGEKQREQQEEEEEKKLN